MLMAYYYCAQGGVTSVVKQRLPALWSAGWEVDFVFRHNMGAKQDLLNAGIRHVTISEKSFVNNAIHMANSEPYDCAVVFDVPELIQPMTGSFRGSLIYEIHTPIPENLNKNSVDVLLTPDMILVPSRWSKDWLLNRFPGVPSDRITVVPNVVNEAIFSQHGPRKEGLKNTLLWVGKLNEYKNWEEAVQIGLAFLREHREWRFLMATGGDYSEEVVKDLLRYISAEDVSKRVSWIHNLQLAEMGVLYRSVASGSGMLLSSSLAESFCLVIHEAMRCGLPVVSTNVGAVPDIIVDNSTGLLYNTGNIQEALRKLDSLIKDKRLRHGLVSNAFEILEEFSTERLCSQYLETLYRIVSTPSARSTLWDEIERLYGINDMAASSLANSISATFNRSASREEKVWIESIEVLRNRLNSSSQEVTFVDYGAGSPELNLTSEEMYQGQTLSSTLGKICRTGSKQPIWCFLLFKLIREIQPVTCLELGTCLGISTAYQAAALELNGRGQITTLEGAATLVSIAKKNLNELGLGRANVIVGRFQDKLPEVLRAQEHIDFAFIDGHHDERATLTYFELILPFMSEGSFMVFDDIRWSTGMQRAWHEIIADKKISVSIDLNSVGICIIRETSAQKLTLTIALEQMLTKQAG